MLDQMCHLFVYTPIYYETLKLNPGDHTAFSSYVCHLISVKMQQFFEGKKHYENYSYSQTWCWQHHAVGMFLQLRPKEKLVTAAKGGFLKG